MVSWRKRKKKKKLTSRLTGERPVRKLREGPIAGRVGSQSLSGWGNTVGEGSAGFQVPPRPRPALTEVATGRRPEPLRCSATSGHLLQEPGVRGQPDPGIPGPQPHSHSLDSQDPNAAMPWQRDRKWAWPRWPRATLRGKPEADILNVVFIRGSRHLGSAYGSQGQLRAGRFGQEDLSRACIQASEFWDNSKSSLQRTSLCSTLHGFFFFSAWFLTLVFGSRHDQV